MRLSIRHDTTYNYDEELEACYNRGLLRPRQTPTQQLLSSELRITPEPDLVREHQDYFGNHSVYLETRTPTTSRRNLRMVENEAWQTPFMNPTSAVSRGPNSPAFATCSGSGA